MSAVSFTVFGKAAPAGSKTVGRKKDGGIFVRDANPSAAEWKRLVSQRAGEAMPSGGPLLEGPLELTLFFYLPRPKGHFNKKGLKDSAPRFPTVAPDATKLVRAVEDAMESVVYRNDAQIVSQDIHKEYGEPARVSVFVAQL